MYCIFDEARKELMKNEGIPIGLGVYIPKHAKLTDVDNAIAKGIEEGKAFKADSIAALAEQIGVPPQKLQDTVEAYNNHCDSGHDGEFAKAPQYLHKIQQKNFYAVTSSFRVFTTMGGVKINHNTEVLDREDRVIKGLYAGGNCAGGMYGSDYSILTCGGALGFAVYSGLTAGAKSVEYIKSH
jgi:fumarate reductase flavoprotein subunit